MNINIAFIACSVTLNATNYGCDIFEEFYFVFTLNSFKYEVYLLASLGTVVTFITSEAFLFTENIFKILNKDDQCE